jgi:hypothetical protein
VHECSTEGFGARPGLRTAAVYVDSVYEGGEQGGAAGDFEGGVYAELGDCWWRGGGECEVLWVC